jgi:alpha-beta hydrolase superfamily lysophospholipase
VHWAYQKLAVLLASNGFSVLRFDYSCTGDSAGDSEDAALDQWVDDIRVAADELRDSAGVRRVSLVGMRLGGVLAMRAATAGLTVRDLVLWDPIVDGQRYFNQIEKGESWVSKLHPYPVADYAVAGEINGYAVTERMQTDLRAINITAEPLARPRRVLVVAPIADAGHAELIARMQASDIPVTYTLVEDPLLYWERSYPVDTLVAHAGPRAIASFLSEGR